MTHHNKKYWGTVKVTTSVRGIYVIATATHSSGAVTSVTLNSLDFGGDLDKTKAEASLMATERSMSQAADKVAEQGRKR